MLGAHPCKPVSNISAAKRPTSNICTNQGLLAPPRRKYLILAALGPTGSAETGRRAIDPKSPLRGRTPGERRRAYRSRLEGPFFKEFVIRTTKDPVKLLNEVGRLGYHGGIALNRWYPEFADAILVAVTEKRTKAEIEGLGGGVCEGDADGVVEGETRCLPDQPLNRGPGRAPNGAGQIHRRLRRLLFPRRPGIPECRRNGQDATWLPVSSG